MESQRVRCLIVGYLLGWLDFEYKGPFSQLKEDLILQEVHRKLLSDVLFLKTVKEASLSGGLVTMDTKHAKWADKTYEGYIRSVLPSLIAPTTIVKTPQDKEHWAKFINEKQKQVDEMRRNNKLN